MLVCGLRRSMGMEVSWFAVVWGSGGMGVALLSEGGGGLVTGGGYGLNASFHVNVMMLMWSLSREIGKQVSTKQRALK